MNKRGCYVYLMTNRHHTVLYTGVTNNLERRVYEHKHHLLKGFTDRYNVEFLVYYDGPADPETAINLEKRIKSFSRKKKEQLINHMNPHWKDLSEEWYA